MDVNCLQCGEKIGEYAGPIGWNEPIQAVHYTRVDGTKPGHGESSMRDCPSCKKPVNEVMAAATIIHETLINEESNHATASNSDPGEHQGNDPERDIREASQDP